MGTQPVRSMLMADSEDAVATVGTQQSAGVANDKKGLNP